MMGEGEVVPIVNGNMTAKRARLEAQYPPCGGLNDCEPVTLGQAATGGTTYTDAK